MYARAFTMIEMVAVVMILALVAGLALLNFSGSDQDGSGADFAARLEELASSARLRALRQGREVRLVYRDAGREWMLEDGEKTERLKLPEGAQLEVDGQRLKAEDSCIFRFQPDGRADGEAATVVLAAAGRCWKLSASRLTGDFSCREEPYPDPRRTHKLMWESDL